VRVCVVNTRFDMRPSSGRFSTCFVLSARSRVCVHSRVATYSGHFLLRYFHGTSLCNLKALRRLRPHTCVCSCVSQQLPDVSIFSIATYSFSHICTLSNTHFCSCFHYQYYNLSFSYIRKYRHT